MTKFAPLLIALILTGCASYDGLGKISPDAVPKVGKITEKETVISRIVENNPVYTSGFGYGYGYGRYGYGRWGGWGYDPFFNVGYRTSVRDDVFYQYKEALAKLSTPAH